MNKYRAWQLLLIAFNHEQDLERNAETSVTEKRFAASCIQGNAGVRSKNYFVVYTINVFDVTKDFVRTVRVRSIQVCFFSVVMRVFVKLYPACCEDTREPLVNLISRRGKKVNNQETRQPARCSRARS